MLFKLSIKNIKKSFKDYAIYFFTLILGITIFYTFNSLESQSVMINLNKSTNNSINMIALVLSAISVFIAFVLGFLIIYANRFLMKRRNKEFGVYMTLGMSKWKISKILLFETILIGLISLVVGLILGIAMSQIMSIVVANMFEADMNKFRFVISNSAIVKTIICFCIIYLLVMIFNIVQVNRCKLINLMQSNQKSEQVKIKNPYICIVVFILGVGILFYSYYNVTADTTSLATSVSVYMQIIYGIIGTFLIFWSLSGFILKLVISRQNIYYRGLNSFTLKQISSKINTMVISITVICIMLFITICIFSSSVSMNISLKYDMQKLAMADISINNFLESSRENIKEVLVKENFDINKDLKDIVNFNTYRTDEVTLKQTYGSYYKILKKDLEDDGVDVKDYFDEKETIVRISDYNSLAKLYGKETYTLNDDQFIIFSNYKNTIEWYNNGLKDNTDFEINGKKYTAKYRECKDGYLMMSQVANNTGFIVVPDDAVNESMIGDEILAANYSASNNIDRQKTEDKITSIKKDFKKDNNQIYISTKIDIYNNNISSSAMAIFVGLYIGIVFIISSAAILALKELSEATDSKSKYSTLRKIGIDENQINKSLFIQIGVFFGFPLILAIIHSIFGLQVCNMMLDSFNKISAMKSIITTSLFLVLIYGGYFVITYLCSKNIIKEE